MKDKFNKSLKIGFEAAIQVVTGSKSLLDATKEVFNNLVQIQNH